MQPLAGDRLDVFVAARFGIDRLEARRWILSGAVEIEGARPKPSLRLWPGANVRVTPLPPRPSALEPQKLDVPLLYADHAIVVIDKPSGMASHPGPGWWRGSVMNALLHQIPDWPGVGGVAQPGVVHRLDRDTSGLLIFAKTDQAHRHLLDQVRDRRMRRTYLAWVAGERPGSGLINLPLMRDPSDPEQVIVSPNGKEARTRYEAIAVGPGRSLLRLVLETGRTHQIRVHLAAIGHPILGDPRYHPEAGPGPMALHAWRLCVAHPSGEPMEFEAPPPSSWDTYGALPSLPR